MTDRLSQLLHQEAAALDAPAPHTSTLLAQGKRLRRREQLTAGAAAVAVAAVVVATAGFVLLQNGDPDARDVGPAGAGQDAAPAAFGVGSDIHLGDVVAQVPDTVHSLHHTSLGVLVRSNANGGASDGSGPESLTLVRWDGSTTDLGTIPEGVGPATDPEQDVYVLAEARGDGFVAVVRDALTGETVLEQPLPDLPPSYWEVPPLALDDDTLYVGYRKEVVAVDLVSKETATVEGLPGGIPDVTAGRTVTGGEDSVEVLDVSTGEVLLSVETDGYAYGVLSPDGRFLRVEEETGIDEQGNLVEPEDVLTVYDVATGDAQELEGAYGWGWTADGGLFRPDRDTLTTCDAASGACETQPINPPLAKNADLRLGGVTYES